MAIKAGPAPGGFGDYLNAVKSSVAEIEAEARTEAGFASVVTSESFGPVNIVAVWSDPVCISRSASCISSDDRSHYFVTFVRRGRGEMQHNGRHCVLSPANFTVGDMALPHATTFSLPSVRLVVCIPHAIVQTRREIDSILGHGIEATTGIGRIASRYFFDIFAERGHLGGDDRAAAMRAGIELICAAVVGLRSPALECLRLPDQPRNAAMLARTRTYLRKHLRDPELSPERIARANGISVRYLHRLFEPTGESVAASILRGRLEGCHGDLTDPRLQRTTITEIALSWGFNEASHFSRVFTRRFGITARELRASRVAGGI